jgi:hypothetical protein
MCPPIFRALLFAVLAAGAIAAESAAPLPPLRATLSGQLALPQIPGFPGLAWQIETRPVPGFALVIMATATAPGLALRVELTPPFGTAPGTWRLVDATVDAASWWRLAADQLVPNAKNLPPDFTLTGRLSLAGEGEWRGADFSGTLRVVLSEGTAASSAQKWTASGLALEAELRFTPARVALRTARLRVATALVAGLTAQRVVLDANGTDGNRLAITRAELAAFGGRVALTPFTLDPAAPAVVSTAEFSGIALGDLAALVPQALKAAQGQVAGRVAVNWSLRSGLGPGDGSLAVTPAEPATLRLAAAPGLLTGRSPPRIALLPAFMGPVRRWLSIDNPAHAMLQRIELGEVPLAVDSFDFQLYPDGAGGSRSVQVRVVARTTGVGDVVEKVTFTVNVSGPLDQVLRLGMDERAKIRVNPVK